MTLTLRPAITRRHLFLSLLGACAGAGAAHAENVEQELRNVRAYFTAQPKRLRNAQGLLQSLGFYGGAANGKWNKATEAAFRTALKQYIAIGGNGPDWGVNQPGDTPRFVQWLDTAARANATGTDYPD